MEFDDYQKQAQTTAIYPDGPHGFMYLVLGLCGESGEIAEKVKKIIRDEPSFYEGVEKNKENIKKELGDVLWYLSSLSKEIGSSLEEVAEENMKKLKSRKKRGKINGSGDNR